MQYKEILENISDWLWKIDTFGKYTYCSQNVFDFLGYTVEEMIGKTPFNFMSEEESLRVSNLFGDLIIHRAPIKGLENEIIHKDGSIIILKTSALPVYDEDGIWLGYEGIDQDITYEKNLEKELGKNYLKLHKLTENIPGAIYQYRLYPDGRMTFPYGSSGTQDIWEVSADDLLNDALLGLNRVHPDDMKMTVAAIEDSAKTLKDFNIEYRVNLPKRGLRWIHGRAKPEKLEDGGVLWHGYAIDITEQKELELELIKSQEHLSLTNQINRTIIDTIPIRIFWQDKDCKYLGANKVFLDDANLSTEQDIVGKSDFELPWRGLAQKYIDDDLEVINSGKAKLNIQETLKVRDGEILNIQTSKSPLRDKDNNIIGLVCTFVDITQKIMVEKNLKITNAKLEQKKNELERIIQESPNPIILHDESGKILMINQEWFNTTGYSIEEIPTINDLIEQIYDDEESKIFIKERIYSLYKLTKKEEGSEFTFLNKNRDLLTWKFRSAPLGVIDGKRVVISSAMDITELKQKEEMLINQSRHAAMGEMIGMIAHQWRQPLSTISMDANNMLLDIAMGNLDVNASEEYANNITLQTQNLSKTIDDFRNFFKPDKVISKVNIRDVLDQALSILKDSLKNHNIQLKISYQTEQEVNAYPRELMQVFINIINNSKDALVSKKIENGLINVRVYEDEIYINTEICDNAGGINADILAKVFDPYFSTKDEKTGTGLGLYMSKMIIQEHLNGIIEANNNDNGACFTVSLHKEL